jgi:hypothetical protein
LWENDALIRVSLRFWIASNRKIPIKRRAPRKPLPPIPRGKNGKAGNKSIVRRSDTTSSSTVGNRAKMSAVISHTEMLDPFGCPGGVWAYEINPGLDGTFTWLQFQSKMWEAYRFLKLNFRYVPSCSMTASGTISMAFDYDCLDTAPTDVTVMSNYATFKSTSIRTPLMLNLSPSEMVRLFKSHAVRHASIGTNDRKTYDVGTLYILTEGDTLDLCGTIYVDYTVEFYQPTVPPDGLTYFDFSPRGWANTYPDIDNINLTHLFWLVTTTSGWSVPGVLRPFVDAGITTLRDWAGSYTTLISGAMLYGMTFLRSFSGQLQVGHNSGYAVYQEDWVNKKDKDAKGKDHVGADVLAEVKFFPGLYRVGLDPAGTATISGHGIASDYDYFVTPIHDSYPVAYALVGPDSGADDTHVEYYDVNARAGDILVFAYQFQHAGVATDAAECSAIVQPWLELLDIPAQIQAHHLPQRHTTRRIKEVKCESSNTH